MPPSVYRCKFTSLCMVELCGLMSDNDQKLEDLLQEINLLKSLPYLQRK